MMSSVSIYAKYKGVVVCNRLISKTSGTITLLVCTKKEQVANDLQAMIV